MGASLEFGEGCRKRRKRSVGGWERHPGTLGEKTVTYRTRFQLWSRQGSIALRDTGFQEFVPRTCR